jgi:hypothetical protein
MKAIDYSVPARTVFDDGGRDRPAQDPGAHASPDPSTGEPVTLIREACAGCGELAHWRCPTCDSLVCPHVIQALVEGRYP